MFNMDRTRTKAKKKMTKEQVQLAIIKKKECDSKALLIVERLLESEVDPEWLLKNLIHINKCHLEDVIEERAITKLCGYVLCQKPLTKIINQHYHISLKNKKVYDITKRKNFCSSSCYGASNYLIEQMLTSPLWLRDEEEIPEFRIFCKNNATSNISHGEELDIAIIDHNLIDKIETSKDLTFKKEYYNIVDETIITQLEIPNEKKVFHNIHDFSLERVENKSTNEINLKENCEIPSSTDTIKENVIPSEKKVNQNIQDLIIEIVENISVKKTDLKKNCKISSSIDLIKENNELNVNARINDTHFLEKNKNANAFIDNKYNKVNMFERSINLKKKIENKKKCYISTIYNVNLQNIDNSKYVDKVICDNNINLAARIEKSFQEWITKETIDFLFGDDFIKQKTIENIERQDKYSILCKKLNKLQFQNEQEDPEFEILKPKLKPPPHFAILQEEGQKLDLKVRAFYKGTTIIEKNQSFIVNEEASNSETFLPLIHVQAPHILRRKIFLEKLDQILPELLRTLAGNNDVYARSSCNYTSVRCTAVKALINTFSLSAKNIIFKTIEWTLVGLVIIKMLSLLDPWLATLLLSQQANMYISMILTSYKLDPHYLNFLVTSFNPNMDLT